MLVKRSYLTSTIQKYKKGGVWINMTIITDVYAREVLDSRGNPTVEVEVYLESGGTRPRDRSFRRFDGCL